MLIRAFAAVGARDRRYGCHWRMLMILIPANFRATAQRRDEKHDGHSGRKRRRPGRPGGEGFDHRQNSSFPNRAMQRFVVNLLPAIIPARSLKHDEGRRTFPRERPSFCALCEAG